MWRLQDLGRLVQGWVGEEAGNGAGAAFWCFPNLVFCLESLNGLGWKGSFKGLLIQPCTEQGYLQRIRWLCKLSSLGKGEDE